MTIVIVAYFGGEWLPACLDTLVGASRDKLHLCLVDNSGNEGAIPESLPNFDYTLVRTPRPLGFAEANNFALRETGLASEYTCFLNQDTRSMPGWLDACLECFDAEPRLGAVSPLLRTYDNTDWDPGFRDCANELPGLIGQASKPEPAIGLVEIPRVTAAAVVVRTEALRRAGPFDPIFGSYYEDYDLCMRIRNAGYRIGICGAATVCHYSGSATTTDATRRKRMRQVIRNRAILRFREAGDRRLPEIGRYLAGSLPRNLGRSLLRTPSSQPFFVQLSAHWDLVRQWRRLVSSRYDRQAWDAYLANLRWSTAVEQSAAASDVIPHCSAPGS